MAKFVHCLRYQLLSCYHEESDAELARTSYNRFLGPSSVEMNLFIVRLISSGSEAILSVCSASSRYMRSIIPLVLSSVKKDIARLAIPLSRQVPDRNCPSDKTTLNTDGKARVDIYFIIALSD